ncbi:hypothetical protein [Novosphingobium sp.]|uniref:hypothetical protein n=1 Tax=Novosphingobium sp. TaxID=1874826 RepID=UPI003B51AC96
MRYVRLLAVADEYDNTPGLILKGTPMCDGVMADREGGLIAHDILEHQNGPSHIGPIDDELEALGGVWHVRGRWGDMCQKYASFHSPASSVASDIVRMLRDLDGSDWWPELGRYRTHSTYYEDDFADILRIAREDIPKELNAEDLRDAPVEAYLDNALHLMRSGFRKAERRFGDRFAGLNLYKAIQEEVGRVSIDYEGQEFILGYGNGEATLREVAINWD